MPRQQKPNSSLSQVVLDARLWNLKLSNLSIKDNKDPERFSRFKHPDSRLFQIFLLKNVDNFHKCCPNSLYLIH